MISLCPVELSEPWEVEAEVYKVSPDVTESVPEVGVHGTVVVITTLFESVMVVTVYCVPSVVSAVVGAVVWKILSELGEYGTLVVIIILVELVTGVLSQGTVVVRVSTCGIVIVSTVYSVVVGVNEPDDKVAGVHGTVV